MPMKELPPAALAYARGMCRLYGMCMEVLLTAYATYAQIAEGLTCNDELYRVDKEHRRLYDQVAADEPAIVEAK